MLDLKGGAPTDWLVIGWFTPDYRPMAEQFAANLTEHGAPFHLWSKPKSAGWDTRRKPSVVLEAMDAHPGKTLVLMDVDCIVRGDIAPVADIDGDVAVRVLARATDIADVAVLVGSRVIVFRPTPGARALAKEWARFCALPTYRDDENALTWAYLSRSEVASSRIEPRYYGIEAATAGEECIIVHRSTHDIKLRKDGVLRTVGRWVERPFRTGRTRRLVKQLD